MYIFSYWIAELGGSAIYHPPRPFSVWQRKNTFVLFVGRHWKETTFSC